MVRILLLYSCCLATSTENCDSFLVYNFVVIFPDSQVWYLAVGKGPWSEREVQFLFEVYGINAEGQSGPQKAHYIDELHY